MRCRRRFFLLAVIFVVSLTSAEDGGGFLDLDVGDLHLFGGREELLQHDDTVDIGDFVDEFMEEVSSSEDYTEHIDEAAELAAAMAAEAATRQAHYVHKPQLQPQPQQEQQEQQARSAFSRPAGSTGTESMRQVAGSVLVCLARVCRAAREAAVALRKALQTLAAAAAAAAVVVVGQQQRQQRRRRQRSSTRGRRLPVE
jgi:hypothetical protein